MARCPNCREPVSQFAAGCAICGADLDAARREQAERRGRRPSLPALPSIPDDVVAIAFLTFVTLALPVLGIVLCLVAIRQRSLSAQSATRYVLLGVIAFGVLLMVSPEARYGVFALLV